MHNIQSTIEPRTRPVNAENPECRHEQVRVEDLPGNQLKFKCLSCWCLWFEPRPPVRIDFDDDTVDWRRRQLWDAFAKHCEKYSVDPTEVSHVLVDFSVPVIFDDAGEAAWYV